MPSEFEDDWVSQDAIDALGLERSVHLGETQVQLAERLLIESAPMAAQTIIHLATNPGTNDRVRLSAATYIMDRTAGKIGDNRGTDDGKAVWDGVFDAVTKDAEEYANDP